MGLSLWQAVVVITVGNLLWLLTGLLAISGPAAGAPSEVITRAVYGVRGNRVNNAVTGWLISVCYFALNLAAAATSAFTLVEKAGLPVDTGVKAAVIVVIAALTLTISVYGAVRQEHEDVLRFWFERGVAGVRIDSAALLAKDPALPDFTAGRDPHPFVDRDELHDIYRSWRAVADEYGAVFVGEVWLPDAERVARYLRPDELHTAFNFNFLTCPWDADRLRRSIDDTLAEHAPVGAPATWVLCNHDVTRTVTRYGRADTAFDFATKAFGTPTDLTLGTRRARAAALLTLALPGSLHVYQGEELGLPEADIPLDLIQDPMHLRSGGTDPGRDGCRVPLPWAARGPHCGFGSAGEPWLPQPADWASYAADRQAADPGSMLTLYRRAIALRRTTPGFGDGPLTWLPAPDDVLAFTRPQGLTCVVNLSTTPVVLPAHTTLLLTSGPLARDSRLPQDTAAWLRT